MVLNIDSTGIGNLVVPGATADQILNLTLVQFTEASIAGNGISATSGINPVNAEGAVLAAGTTANSTNSANINETSRNLSLQLQDVVPVGSIVRISTAKNDGAGAMLITDGVNSQFFNAGAQDIIEHVNFVVGTDTNTIDFSIISGDVWIDGVDYNISAQTCDLILNDSETIVVGNIFNSGFIMTANCDGATAAITGDTGGTFTFNPAPTDGAIIDAVTGTVTNGVANTSYTVEYGQTGSCSSSSPQTFTVLPTNDSSFDLTATCDGATATITGDSGGVFTFNPVPTDGAIIDPINGTITNGVSGSVYNVDYAFTGVCLSITNMTISVLDVEDSTFTYTSSCSLATATITGDLGGTFSFNPVPADGAIIDTVTGEITNPVQGSTYSVDYVTSGPCPETSNVSVTILVDDVSTFTMTETCDGAIATLDLSTTTGGVFSFNPVPTDGATINAITGEVSGGLENVTYTVNYLTSGVCSSNTDVSFTVLDTDDSMFTMTASAPNCNEAIATLGTGSQTGGIFTFNPIPADGAMIDPATGTITNGIQGSTYIAEYTTLGICPSTTTVSVTLNPQENATFTITPSCDGGLAILDSSATIGGVFSFNPVPTDGAIIDSVSGQITSGISGVTYTIQYETAGPCPVSDTVAVTVPDEEDATFTMIPNCEGATAILDPAANTGGTFSFNPIPTDTAVIDVSSGEITLGLPGVSYNVEYTTPGPCPDTVIVTVTVFNPDDSSFTLQATCDGAIANVTGLPGGIFSFNPVPSDGAIVDVSTGTISNAPFGGTYTLEYTTNITCPTTSTQTVTVLDQPVLVNPTPLEVCDDSIADGST